MKMYNGKNKFFFFKKNIHLTKYAYATVWCLDLTKKKIFNLMEKYERAMQ